MIERTINELAKLVGDWTSDRPIIDKHNRENIDTILQMEVDEAKEEVDPEKKAFEYIDVLFVTLSALHNLGVDVNEMFMAKMARNMAKYPAKDYQEGDYKEKRLKSRAEWNGDEEFFGIS